MTFRKIVPCLAVTVAMATCGCSPSMVIVKGKITQGGKPYLGSKGNFVGVSFNTIEEADRPGNSFPAEFNSATGEFTVRGVHRKGIPKGRYRIVVERYSSSKGKDKLKGEFSGANSPIIRDVQGQDIDIDLDHPTAK